MTTTPPPPPPPKALPSRCSLIGTLSNHRSVVLESGIRQHAKTRSTTLPSIRAVRQGSTGAAGEGERGGGLLVRAALCQRCLHGYQHAADAVCPAIAPHALTLSPRISPLLISIFIGGRRCLGASQAIVASSTSVGTACSTTMWPCLSGPT